MGICSSCDSSAVSSTAKLILQNGKLQEFARPIKVSHVLQDPKCFVCSSDDMEFDDFVSPLNADEGLEIGQLYFVLPRSMLKHPLHAEDMAALAVKASAALMKSSSLRDRCRRRRRCVMPVPLSPRSRVDTVIGGRRMEQEVRREPSGESGSGRNFMSKLSVIPEENSGARTWGNSLLTNS